MKNIEVFSDFLNSDPYGNPLVMLKIDGRIALFAKQLASTFEGSTRGADLLQRLRNSEVYKKGQSWQNLTFQELIEIQRLEKITSGKS